LNVSLEVIGRVGKRKKIRNPKGEAPFDPPQAEGDLGSAHGLKFFTSFRMTSIRGADGEVDPASRSGLQDDNQESTPLIPP